MHDGFLVARPTNHRHGAADGGTVSGRDPQDDQLPGRSPCLESRPVVGVEVARVAAGLGRGAGIERPAPSGAARDDERGCKSGCGHPKAEVNQAHRHPLLVRAQPADPRSHPQQVELDVIRRLPASIGADGFKSSRRIHHETHPHRRKRPAPRHGQRRGEMNLFEDSFTTTSSPSCSGTTMQGRKRLRSRAGVERRRVRLPRSGERHLPLEITEDMSTEKLRQCLDGHPVFAQAPARSRQAWAARDLHSRQSRHRNVVPGPGAASAPRRAGGCRLDPVLCTTDSYYLPEGIQIRHGHQFEGFIASTRANDTRTTRRPRVLDLPWGALWLEVVNPRRRFARTSTASNR